LDGGGRDLDERGRVTLDGKGQLGVATEERWVSLRELGPGRDPIGGGLAALGPGDVLSGWSGSTSMPRFHDGRTSEVAPRDNGESPSLVTHLGELGPMAALGDSGLLTSWNGQRWEARTPVGKYVAAMAALRGALVVGLRGGTGILDSPSALVQVLPEGTRCPIAWEGTEIRGLAPFQDKLVGVAGNGGDDELLIIEVR
jgi:hypothetical protein